MVNITHPELSETKAQALPAASLESLKQLREESCSISSSRDFKLQPNQRFLRRVMSPDSPTRNLLLVHGTGVGKTCTAIQIAEEYIIRPEFQDKRVFVLANPSIQENFKSQIFDITRVNPDEDGVILSKQCTGRRYFDMIQRSQSEPLRYTDKSSQLRIMKLASRIIGEFYEFQGYQGFADTVTKKQTELKTQNEMDKWIRETFNDRLIIVDEAHNLRETTETESSKLVAVALERILKTATGITLVLLTATPMYDRFDELLYYFNLFLWNDRRINLKESVKASDIFKESGEFKDEGEVKFRGWCQDYISYVKGGNPFTFPFRLPPPDNLIAPADRTTDIFGKPIERQRKYLTLTGSFVSPQQEAAIKGLTVKATSDTRLICMFPDNKSFRDTFQFSENAYSYNTEKFLAPSKVPLYSSKFGRIMNILNDSSGVVFVYSNLAESGAKLFSMCLEEHGFEAAIGQRLLKETSNEVPRGSKGKYVLFTSETTDSDINKALVRLRRPENADGSDIRVVIASPKVSEGVDFRYVRQIHVLDPWFNMSRIEQVLGRGMRTCSHSLLPFEDQNCTVYLHVCRYPTSTQETLDEYIYRYFVEGKGHEIAKVKRVVMESAMDCTLQENINNLPPDWRGDEVNGQRFRIPQKRAQDGKELLLTLTEMSAPTFEDGSPEFVCNIKESQEDPAHVRPLSAILDMRDEVLDKVMKLFLKKPIWTRDDLYSHSYMKQYTPDVLDYIIQNAIETGFQLKDKSGRVGHLEAKGDVFAFGIGKTDTVLERIIDSSEGTPVDIPGFVSSAEPEVESVVENSKKDSIQTVFDNYDWKPFIKNRFSDEVRNWYLLDNDITAERKIEAMLEVDWTNPPIYAKPLLITKEDGGRMYALGSKKIYTDKGELIEGLVGSDRDAYNKWISERKDVFIDNRNNLFASMKEKVIVFNLDEKSEEIKRASRSKTIGGRTCTTYKETTLNAFSMWLVGEPFPPEVKTKKDRCMFLDLLVREAVSSSKEGIFWVTPEEFEIFNEDEHRGDLLRRLKD
jgi:superfamily II DNA or RNA helicase